MPTRRRRCCCISQVRCSRHLFSLEEEGGSDNYQKATVTLNKYFKPQANVPYDRLCFQETSQLHTETVEQFVTRLRQKAKTCEFGYAQSTEFFLPFF